MTEGTLNYLFMQQKGHLRVLPSHDQVGLLIHPLIAEFRSHLCRLRLLECHHLVPSNEPAT